MPSRKVTKVTQISQAKKVVGKQKIPWEYCECGCHGFELRLGPVYLWMFNNLRGTQVLSASHGDMRAGSRIGQFRSAKACDDAARAYIKAALPREEEQLRQTRKGLRKAKALL